MKIRAVLKSLLFSYALTGVSLLLLAFLLFTFDLGETAVDAGIIVVYVPASWAALWLAGWYAKISICGAWQQALRTIFFYL